MRWKSERHVAENANFDEKAGEFDAQYSGFRGERPFEGRDGRQTDSFIAAQERLIACCDTLRRALDDIEQSIEAPDLSRRQFSHRSSAAIEAPRQSPADSEPDAPASNVTMRDMTGFLLSKEGDRFLNLLRRMIREEIDRSRQDEPSEPRNASRSGRVAQDVGAGDVEGLRALVRRRMRKD